MVCRQEEMMELWVEKGQMEKEECKGEGTQVNQ